MNPYPQDYPNGGSKTQYTQSGNNMGTQQYGQQYASNQYQPSFPNGGNMQNIPNQNPQSGYPQQPSGFLQQNMQSGGYTQQPSGFPQQNMQSGGFAPPISGYSQPSSGYMQQNQPIGYPQQSGGFPQQNMQSGTSPQQSGFQGGPPNWLQQGGYQTNQPHDAMSEWFRSADTNNDGRINASELQRALSLSGGEYSLETVRDMFQMFDMDESGTIERNEFAALYQFIQQMKDSFRQNEVNGEIPCSQVPNALSVNRSIGFHMNSLSTIMGSLLGLLDNGNGRLNQNQFLKMALCVGRILTGYEKGSLGNHGAQGYQQPPSKYGDFASLGNQVMYSLSGKNF